MKELRVFLKKVVLLQAITITLSIVAFILALKSFNAVKIVKSNNYLSSKKTVKETSNLATDANKDSSMKKKMPDVEIVKTDGNIVKVNVNAGVDKIGSSIAAKKDIKTEKKDEVNNSMNENLKAQVALDKGNISIKEKGSLKKNDTGNDEKKDKKSDVKMVDRAINNGAQPEFRGVKSSHNGQNSSVVGNNFLVQIGAFQEISAAKLQCQKANLIIKNKNCSIVAAGSSLFRSIVSGFNTKEEAMDASSKLSFELKTNCFVKEDM